MAFSRLKSLSGWTLRRSGGLRGGAAIPAKGVPPNAAAPPPTGAAVPQAALAPGGTPSPSSSTASTSSSSFYLPPGVPPPPPPPTSSGINSSLSDYYQSPAYINWYWSVYYPRVMAAGAQGPPSTPFPSWGMPPTQQGAASPPTATLVFPSSSSSTKRSGLATMDEAQQQQRAPPPRRFPWSRFFTVDWALRFGVLFFILPDLAEQSIAVTEQYYLEQIGRQNREDFEEKANEAFMRAAERHVASLGERRRSTTDGTGAQSSTSEHHEGQPTEEPVSKEE